jgi:transcriptional regulator with XRE-family HTH domain
MYDSLVDVPRHVALRADRGWSKAELARRSGVSYSMIKYVESGVCQYSDVTAAKVARAFGCSVKDFSTPKATSKGAA